MCIQCFLVLISVCETYRIHLPTSVFYQFFMAYGQIASFYEKDNVNDHFKFVIGNKIFPVILLFVLNLFFQYIVSLTVVYLTDQNKLIMSQLQVARLSLRVIMNHLDEALFLRTDDGKLGYSNTLGVKIVE